MHFECRPTVSAGGVVVVGNAFACFITFKMAVAKLTLVEYITR